MKWLSWLRGKETSAGKGAGQRPMFIQPAARDRWGSQVLSTWTPELIESTIRGAMSGDLTRQWELFELMESTWYRLQKNLEQIKASVISMDWEVQPWARKGEEPTPEAVRKAELVDDLIWDFRPRPDYDENDFEDTIRDILDARGKGISVLEVDWEARSQRSEVGGRKPAGRIGIRATRHVHPKYYGYPFSGEDRLMLRVGQVRQNNPSAPLVVSEGDFAPVPPDKFILAVCKAKSGHPISGAMLRCLGFWWAATNFTGPWLLNFCQLFGQPIRWATYDPNMATSDRQVLEEMMENMGSAAWALFPSGTQLELKEAVKGGTDNPQIALFDLADKICDIRILGQTLTSDVADSGSRALGDVHEGVLAGVKDSLATWAAKVIRNQVIRPLLRLNFGDDEECPFLVASAAERVDPKLLAERDQVLNAMGLELPKTWLYERHGVPEPQEGEETLEKAEGGMKNAEWGRPGGGKAEGGMQNAEGEDPEKTKEEKEKIMAKEATDKLAENVIEELTGVQAKWLGGVKPFFARLIAIAQSRAVSDAEFIQALEDSRKHLPELFNAIDHDALATAMEKAMAAAVVNGAVTGHLKRSALKAKGGTARPAPQTKPRKLTVERNERGHLMGATIE